MEIVNKEKVEQNIRNSAIDLLKIIAIFLICLSHANETMKGVADFPTFTIANMMAFGFTPFGEIGNILFVICSSYFLVSKRTTRVEKAIRLLIDAQLISIIILLCFLFSGADLSLQTIIKQVFPNIFGMNWFVPCYVIYYLLAPIVVYGLQKLSRRQHLGLLITSFIVYGGLGFVDLAPVGSRLLQFFYILNAVAFIKWHIPSIYKNKKANLLIFVIGMFVFYVFFIGFIALTKLNDFFGRFAFTSMYSPILVIPLLAFFNCFVEMRFHNKAITYLSTCSLFVYVIHENYLLRTITRVEYYKWALDTFGDSLAAVYVIICGLFMFFVGFALAIIYKETIGRLTFYPSEAISRAIKYSINKIDERIE